MLTLIEVKNYRCLRYIRQQLGPFQVLVGPNASGKTTFLDVISFLGDLISDGIDAAVTRRSANYHDLTFAGNGGDIELAVQAQLPDEIAKKFQIQPFSEIRYEVRMGLDEATQEHSIFEERVILLTPQADVANSNGVQLKFEFPAPVVAPYSILNQKYPSKTSHPSLKKLSGGNDNFYDEMAKESGKKGWMPSFRLGPKKSALGNLPEDEHRFPASTWFKRYLTEGVQSFVLDSRNIRQASAPGQGLRFRTDGANLPWVIHNLKSKAPDRFERWIEHIRTALPDIETIETIERPDDKHRYLKVHYAGGIQTPSWLVSDGTLRLLALTLPAYLPDFSGVYLIEEPENGVHPKAIETVYQSLSSVYNAQILMASHSPVMLSMVEPGELLCFAKNEEGATDIVSGDKHPQLRMWQGETNLSILFASGILG